jgi:transposase
MSRKKLTTNEVSKRMTELRNLQTLHRRDRQQISDLTEALNLVASERDELKQLVATQAIQIAELQTMVFGKKKKPPTGTAVPALPNPVALPRTKHSYRRPLPPASAITTTEVIPVDYCQCGGELTKFTTHNRYQEDIPLPELTAGYQARLVTKYVISRGICARCGKVTSGQDLGGQAVTLGPNVRLLICHLVSVAGLSYNGVAMLLRSLYGISVSDGEIANVVAKQHATWLPAYGQLKSDIRAAPAVHADETPWAIQQNDGYGYAWCLSDATSEKVYYSLENSRGAPHAKRLFGQDTDQPFTGVRISDDYGVYRALPGIQQLCWAHLYRAIRDLRYNDNLPEDQLPYVTQWYEQFASLYQELRTRLAEPHDRATRTAQSDNLWQRLVSLLPANEGEPEKLTKLKAQLTRAGQPKLFACLTYDTPCDNNRAERDLRQLVLKRKRSFGSQTEKGAQALATVLSICTTTWRCNPTGYFKALALVG